MSIIIKLRMKNIAKNKIKFGYSRKQRGKVNFLALLNQYYLDDREYIY